MKRISIITILLLLSLRSLSQSSFSQFYSNPLLINPAYTGMFNGDYRIGGITRNERDAYNQVSTKSSFFYDMNIAPSLVSENDRLAIGLAALKETNLFNGIKNSYLFLSTAYQKGLDETGQQYLRLGFQASFAHKKIEPPYYILEDQLKSWLAAGFMGLSFSQSKVVDINYMDLNAGLYYQAMINSKNLLHAGLSIFHVNSPYVSFDGGTFTEAIQYSLQAGLETSFSETHKLYSDILLTKSNQGIEDSYVSGIYQAQIGHNNNHLGIGCSYRQSKLRGTAFIPCFRLKYNRYSLNVSYDVVLDKSIIARTSGLEISMIFIAKRKPPKK